MQHVFIFLNQLGSSIPNPESFQGSIKSDMCHILFIIWSLENITPCQRASGPPCKFDFEDGIDSWEKTGTAFNNQPTYGDNPTARNRRQPANQQGNWWIGGFEDRPSETAPAGEIQGDGPRGTLTSPYFNIRGRDISFLIGGGNNINLIRAELVINGQVCNI